MAEHNTLTGVELHEPKGAASAPAGTVYIADGAGSGSWTTQPPSGVSFGWFDYNDLTTTTTPISVTGNSTYIPLTNDGLGAFSNSVKPPPGVTKLWDAPTSQLDFTELQIGDTLDIRVDVEVTTTVANQGYKIGLELATTNTPYILTLLDTAKKTSGPHDELPYKGFYMGDNNTVPGMGRILVQSDGNATVKVRGWYIRAIIDR